MRAFLLRRLVHAVFVVWGVVTVVFFLVRLTGDPLTHRPHPALRGLVSLPVALGG